MSYTRPGHMTRSRVVNCGRFAAGVVFCLALPLYIPVCYSLDKTRQIFELSREELRDVLCRRAYESIERRSNPSASPVETEPRTVSQLGTSFCDLPLELRLRIYDEALGDRGAIIQIARRSQFAPYPPEWKPGQKIRSDADSPSSQFLTINGWDSNGYRQTFSAIPENNRLICSEQVAWRRRPSSYTNLMSACRTVYADLIYRLYAENTMSFFGFEMLDFYSRTASPVGLGFVRYVHIALTVSAKNWMNEKSKKKIESGMRELSITFPNLRQLDVEIAITYGQPVRAGEFWVWIVTEVVAKQFTMLDKFVLKVPVYVSLGPETKRTFKKYYRHIGQSGRLSTWNDGTYRKLQNLVTMKLPLRREVCEPEHGA